MFFLYSSICNATYFSRSSHVFLNRKNTIFPRFLKQNFSRFFHISVANFLHIAHSMYFFVLTTLFYTRKIYHVSSLFIPRRVNEKKTLVFMFLYHALFKTKLDTFFLLCSNHFILNKNSMRSLFFACVHYACFLLNKNFK